MKIVINTSTFGKQDPAPLEELKSRRIEFSLNPFERTLTREEVVRLSKGADGMIAGTEPLDAVVLEQLGGLKVISRCGTGLENVDTAVCRKLGIQVFATPDAPTRAVAELTTGLMLDLLRKVSLHYRCLKEGIWKKEMGHLLYGKKVGIIGFGRIGRAVAQLLKPFGAQIGYYDVRESWEQISCRFGDLPSLLSWADIVTLHAASLKGAPVILGPEEIKLMKRGAWLVNVARGGLVDRR